jgi:hypothetical protein
VNRISVLKVKNADSRPQKRQQIISSGEPISLLAFLQAENYKLQKTVAQLMLDITALKQASQEN